MMEGSVLRVSSAVPRNPVARSVDIVAEIWGGSAALGPSAAQMPRDVPRLGLCVVGVVSLVIQQLVGRIVVVISNLFVNTIEYKAYNYSRHSSEQNQSVK